MNNSLSFTNGKHDPKGLKNPKFTTQGQQFPARSKLYSSTGTKNYSTSTDAQQPLLQLGFRINEKLIGTGSYAKVKRCIREIDNKEFAVKIIDRDKAPSDFVSKFLPRELDIIRTLDHPNIIKVQQILETKSLTLIVMEYASNGDLLDYINKTTRLQESVARRMFRELCDAIYYILDPPRTENKKNVIEKKILSRTFCGSAAYAAPEILRGQEYNPKLYDIWSAGCILYIMIYSKMPFDDSDIKKMIEAQMTKGGLRFGSEGSSEVQDLIARMLQSEVTQRWPIELIQKHPWLAKQTNTDNHGSSISYVNAMTTNRIQTQGGVNQVQKRHGSPIYA
ncbi:unnamed protein product [Rotaria socialis]|nr:unnamed protein product [Rotaria socialis]